MRKERSNDLNKYIQQLYAQEDQLLEQISKNIKIKDKEINISPEEAKLLQILIKMNKVTSVIEIGTHFGYSSIWIARALPSSGKLITFEQSESRFIEAEKNISLAGLTNKITIIKGDATNNLNQISGIYDMIFIDANKSAYPVYLDWAEKNIKSGGLIIADNCLLENAVFDKNYKGKFKSKAINAMKSFNERLSNTEKFETIMLPTEEGFIISIKK